MLDFMEFFGSAIVFMLMLAMLAGVVGLGYEAIRSFRNPGKPYPKMDYAAGVFLTLALLFIAGSLALVIF